MAKSTCRLMFNHSLAPFYLNKININDNPNCFFSNPQLMIIIGYINAAYKINVFVDKLIQIPGIHQSINLSYLISVNDNSNLYKLLYDHLTNINVKL